MARKTNRTPALRDHLRPGLRIVFVGINPGLRSAAVGHHFAGHSNRFWKLLHESGLVDAPLTYREDWRLPEWGLGLTNIINRKSAGIDTLGPAEYRAGRAGLERKLLQEARAQRVNGLHLQSARRLQRLRKDEPELALCVQLMYVLVRFLVKGNIDLAETIRVWIPSMLEHVGFGLVHIDFVELGFRLLAAVLRLGATRAKAQREGGRKPRQ